MIARAIVNRPNIMLMDEATSALDNRTQAIVSESLDRLKATRIVIAHRLSTIAGADKIIVLEEGRIIEIGSHQQLLESGGRYRDMVMLQMTNNQPDAKNI